MNSSATFGMPPTLKPVARSWFVAYCVCFAIAALFFVIGGIYYIANPAGVAEYGEMTDLAEIKLAGISLIAFFVPFLGAFIAAPFLPRRPWAWVVNLILICVGLPLVCCLPFAVALIVIWVREDNRLYYGMQPREIRA